MRFNLVFNFHKHANWDQFYLEYLELKAYLQKAQKFLNEKLDIKRKKKKTSKKYIKKIMREENQNHLSEGHNHELCIQNIHKRHRPTITSISLQVLERQFTDEKKFSQDFIQKFKEKLEKVENFFLEVKKDLEEDFQRLKGLIIECEDIERFAHENVLKNLKSVKHDYKWKSNKQGDELTCRYAFIHFYNLTLMLESFSVLNKLAAEKIYDKAKQKFKAINESEEIRKLIDEFNTIIHYEGDFREELVKFYADSFYAGNENLARKELERKPSVERGIHHVLIAMIEIVIFLLLGFLLLVFLSKNTNEIKNIHVFFPAFSFTLMVTIFFFYSQVLVILFRKFKINYVYLLDLDPQYLIPPEKFLIVRASKIINLYNYIILY